MWVYRFWLVCAACVLVASPVLAASKPRNILLILTDDQGWTGTSVQMDPEIDGSKSDYYRTPQLEALAARGMLFSNAYAPHPNCSPSRYAILTGKSPAQLHMSDIIGRNSAKFYKGFPLTPPDSIDAIVSEEDTIPELLKRIDPTYKTAHFGKWHLEGGGPGEHGFDEHDGSTNNGAGIVEGVNAKRTKGITERSMAFLEQRTKDGAPFFLEASYYAVTNRPSHQPR
jgi:arylsulfatase A